MDNEDFIIRASVVVFGALMLSFSGCMTYQQKRIADSQHPLELSCAFGTSDKACLLISKQASAN